MVPLPILGGESVDIEPMNVPHRSKIDSLPVGSSLEEQYATTIPGSLDLMEPEEVPGVEPAPPRPQRRMGYFDMHLEPRRFRVRGGGGEDIFDKFTRSADAEENDDPPRTSILQRNTARFTSPGRPSPTTTTRATQPRGIPLFFLSYYSAPLALGADSYRGPGSVSGSASGCASESEHASTLPTRLAVALGSAR